MEALIEYFSTIPSSHRSVILIGGLTIFFIIENSIPLFKTLSQFHNGIHLGEYSPMGRV